MLLLQELGCSYNKDITFCHNLSSILIERNGKSSSEKNHFLLLINCIVYLESNLATVEHQKKERKLEMYRREY
jgi:hypothetical protein